MQHEVRAGLEFNQGWAQTLPLLLRFVSGVGTMRQRHRCHCWRSGPASEADFMGQREGQSVSTHSVDFLCPLEVLKVSF